MDETFHNMQYTPSAFKKDAAK